MDPTAAQAAARTNPTPVSFAAPTSDGLFRGTGDYGTQVWYRKGDQLYALNTESLLSDAERKAAGNSTGIANSALSRLKTQYGIDWGSLPEYNLADVMGSAKKIGINRDVYNMGPLAGTLGDLQSLTGTAPVSATQTVNNVGPQLVDPRAAQVQQQVAATTQSQQVNPVAPVGQNVPTGQNGAPAATPTAAPAPAVPVPQYTVMQGDTLSNIARQNGTTTGALLSANPSITDPNRIYAGQKLNLSPQVPTVGTTQSALSNAAQVVAKTNAMLAQTAAEGDRPFSGSQWDTPEYNNIGTALADNGVKVDPQSASELALTNPYKFVNELYSNLVESMGLGEIKSSYENYTKTLTDLTNEKNDKITDLNNNPWLSESMRAKQAESISAKYESRINTATNQAKLMETMYQDGLSQAQFLTGQAVSVFNNAFDAQSQAAMKEMDNAQRRWEATQKLTETPQKGGTPGGGTTESNEPDIASIDPSSPTYMTELMAATKGGKKPNQVETIRPIQKSIAVLNQLADLQSTIASTQTGPVVGYLKNLNPYSFDARAVNAQLQAIVPNLARGVYGEVGVLTDQDIKNYIQTLPNIKSTQAQNDFVTAMTLKTVFRNFESQLETLASAGYDISGFSNQYNQMKDTIGLLERNLGVSANNVQDDYQNYLNAVGNQTGGQTPQKNTSTGPQILQVNPFGTSGSTSNKGSTSQYNFSIF